MPSRTAESPDERRLLELDGLRGLAILLVLIVHYLLVPDIPPQSHVLAFLRRGFALTWSGVDLFFVLSGFLIGGILLDRRDSPAYFSTFYIRRFWRIIPLYVLVLCVFAAGLMVSLPSHWPGLRWLYENPVPLPALLSFTQNFWLASHPSISPFLGVTWSLAVEEHFYLTLPLLIKFVNPKRLPVVLASVLVLSPALRFAVVEFWPRRPLGAYMYTFCRADALAWGVLAAIAVRNPQCRRMLDAHRRWLYAALAVLLAGIAYMTQRNFKFYRLEPLQAAGMYSWLALFYTCLLLLAVTAPSGLVARLLRVRPLRHLGVWAYGTYLFHLPLLFACFGLVFGTAPRLVRFSDFVVLFAALLLSISLAYLSWTFFERPLLHRHRRDY